jgi:hypothetical protein
VCSTALKPILTPSLRRATSTSVSETASKSRPRQIRGALLKKGCRWLETVKTM